MPLDHDLERFRSQESTAGLCQRVPGQLLVLVVRVVRIMVMSSLLMWVILVSAFQVHERKFAILCTAVDLFWHDDNCLKENWWWGGAVEGRLSKWSARWPLNDPYLFDPTRSQLSWTNACFPIHIYAPKCTSTWWNQIHPPISTASYFTCAHVTHNDVTTVPLHMVNPQLRSCLFDFSRWLHAKSSTYPSPKEDRYHLATLDNLLDMFVCF